MVKLFSPEIPFLHHCLYTFLKIPLFCWHILMTMTSWYHAEHLHKNQIWNLDKYVYPIHSAFSKKNSFPINNANLVIYANLLNQVAEKGLEIWKLQYSRYFLTIKTLNHHARIILLHTRNWWSTNMPYILYWWWTISHIGAI